MKEKIKKIMGKKQTYYVGVALFVIVVLIGSLLPTGETKALFHTNQGLVAEGTIEAKEINILSKVPGRLVKVYVEEGEKVKAGDSLFEISSEELVAKKEQVTATLAQAEAALKAAKEQCKQAEAGVAAANGIVEQAKAGVAAANGKLKEAKAGVKASTSQGLAANALKEKAEKGARDQEIAQAQAAYDVMKLSYDRVAALAEKGAVSKQRLDEVKAQLTVCEQTLSMAKEGARVEDKKAALAVSEQAQAGVEASETRVTQAEAGVAASEAQLTQAVAAVQSANALLFQAKAGVEAKEGLVAQTKGAIDEVNAYLKEVVLKAPIDGIVTNIASEEGELISTGTQIGIVSNLEGAWLQVNVKETDLAKVQEKQVVKIKVIAYPDKEFTGTVQSINKEPSFAVKRATKDNGEFDIVSFGVKIKIDNKEEILRPGMTGAVQFEASDRR